MRRHLLVLVMGLLLSTGSLGQSSIALTNAGVFTNSQMNEYATSELNGASPGAEFNAVQAAYATDGIAGAVAMPANATVHQTNAVAGYANSVNPTVGGGGALGGYFQGRALADGTSVWGANALAIDCQSGSQNCGVTKGNINLIGAEVDTQPQNSASLYSTLCGVCTHLYSPKLANFPNSVAYNSLAQNGDSWGISFNSPNGVASNALVVGTIGGCSGSCASQTIQFYASPSGNLTGATINENSIGDIQISPAAGHDVDVTTGFRPDSEGLKHKQAAGCTTAASAGATCTTTISWTTAFADASYTISCTGDGIGSGIPLNGGVTSKVAASVTFQTVAATAAAAAYSNIDCVAVHN